MIFKILSLLLKRIIFLRSLLKILVINAPGQQSFSKLNLIKYYKILKKVDNNHY